MSTSALIVLLVALLVLALLVGPLLTGLAHRLDRLHLRTEAAWAALDAALGRRAAIARSVAATGALGAVLADAADRAEQAPRAEREHAENELTRMLSEVDRAGLPGGLAAELSDAGQRVVLARRVHNDAVRDTLALRRWRTVRWLKLAGTAKLPAYFEMLEPGMTALPQVRRSAARLLLIDPAERLLLFRGCFPERPSDRFWFTVGGGIEDGEDARTAAVRELAEETGLHADPAELTGPVWLRHESIEFGGRMVHCEEWFFLLRTEQTEVDTAGFNQLERDTVDSHRWWHLAELADSQEPVYPARLAELTPVLLAHGWDGETRTIN